MLVKIHRRFCEATSDEDSSSHILLRHSQDLGIVLSSCCVSFHCQSNVKVVFVSLESLKSFLGLSFSYWPFRTIEEFSEALCSIDLVNFCLEALECVDCRLDIARSEDSPA